MSSKAGGVARSTSPLCCQNVSKRLGATNVLENVSLAVASGEVVGLLGPNGAGKTTLMRLVTCLARPSAGTIEVMGHHVPYSSAVASRVGALIEEPALYPWMRGEHMIATVADLGGLTIGGGEIRALLAEVGLAEASRKRVRTYSQGMRQRLGLAVALVLNPALLVLDEPMNALDLDGVRLVRQAIQRRAAAGAGVLVATHRFVEATRLCDRLVVLQAGRIVFDGTLTALAEGLRLDDDEALEAAYLSLLASEP